jgi:predicted membrane protein
MLEKPITNIIRTRTQVMDKDQVRKLSIIMVDAITTICMIEKLTNE